MSIKLSLEKGWFLCHKDFIDGLYADRGLQSKPVFEILTPFRMDGEAAQIAKEIRTQRDGGGAGDELAAQKKRRKRKRSNDDFDQEDSNTCSEFLKVLREKRVFRPPVTDPNIVADNNGAVRRLVRELGQSTRASDDVLVPEGATYHQVQLGSGCSLDRLLEGERFDVVVLDPPWHNKHVKRERKRGRGYDTSDGHQQLSHLLRGLENVLARDALVVFWCTPARNRRELALSLMDTLGLRLIAK